MQNMRALSVILLSFDPKETIPWKWHHPLPETHMEMCLGLLFRSQMCVSISLSTYVEDVKILPE